MKIKRLIKQVFIIVFLFTLRPHFGIGQNLISGQKISGKAADSTSLQPLEFVTISLLSDSSQTVKADYSKTDGSFLLTGLKPGKYALVMSMVGYQTFKISVNLEDSTDHDLGTLLMSPQAVGLSEVMVKAARPIVTQEIDRLSYDLQADPDSKVFNALEMMRKVPFLSLDGEENILLKGSSNYRIFINGKPSGLVERNPKDVLRSMPAASIVRIEVITNPPAKYDAEGMAGIINIITNKSIENGYKGSVTVNERFPVGGPGLGGSVSAQMGKLGIAVLGGASLYRLPTVQTALERATSGGVPTILSQIGTKESKQRSGYLGYELTYEINERHLISSQLNVNGSRTRGTTTQQSLLHENAVGLEGYDLRSGNALGGNSLDASFNYQLGFKGNKERLLTLSYRFYGYGDNQRDEVAFTNSMPYELADYHQSNRQRFGEQSFQLDFVSPIKKVTTELGLKAILRHNNSHFENRSLDGGQYETDTLLSNRFSYDQDVLSAYNSYEYNSGKWGFRAGVRVEQTLIHADFFSADTEVNQQYTNVIPSLALSRKLGGSSMMKLGYVRQISRPSIQRLNPFVDRSNPNVETSGNPNLRPYTFNRIQLSYGMSNKVSLNLGLDYTFVRNIDFRITTFDSLANISRSTYENTGSGDAIDFSLSLRLPISKNWDININGMVSSIWAAVGSATERTTTHLVQSNFTLSTGYRLPKGWRLSASVNPVSPSFRSPQEKANGFLGSSVGITKDIVPGKLSISALAANPFTKYRSNAIRTVGPAFSQQRTTRDYFRSFNVNVTYSFGQLKDQIKRNKRGIKNDDLNR